MYRKKKHLRIAAIFCLLTFLQSLILPSVALALTTGPSAPQSSSFEAVDASDMVNMLTGDFVYNMPLAEVPSPDGGFPINLFYHAGIKTHQEASNFGLGWGFNPGSISRSVIGMPDDYGGEDFNNGLYHVFEDRYDSGTTSTTYSFGFSIPKSNFSLTWSDTHDSRIGNFGSTALNFMSVNILESNYGLGGSGIKIGAGLKPSGSNGLENLGLTSSSFSLRGGVQTVREGMIGNWNVEVTSKGLNLSLFNFNTTTVRQWLDHNQPMLPYGSVMHGLRTHNSEGIHQDRTLLMDIVEDRNHAREKNNTAGAHFAFDNYQVNSGTVGGSIRPNIFQNGSLMGRQFATTTTESSDQYFKLKAFDGYFDGLSHEPERVRFRYNGEFASSYTMPEGLIFQTNQDIQNPIFAASDPGFINAPSDDQAIGFKDRYLKGKKFVEYFGEFDMGYAGLGVGSQVHPPSTKQVKNFVHNIPVNYVERSSQDNSKIHAFKITAEDGSEHHYGLPVFVTYEESVAFETERLENGQSVEQNTTDNAYSRTRKGSAYPYTWLQTAILGNDFIDRNDDGLTDPNDYGSYVRFAYGNHTKQKPYAYRAPFEGYEFDPTFSNKTATFGNKELFYLNGIQTRTHTALFFHEERLDGKGATKDALNGYLNFTQLTVTQLRTEKIVILKNEDVQALMNSGDLTDRGVDWQQMPSNSHDPYMISEFNNAIKSKAIQILDFNYTYDLCQQTSNSDAPGKGKLTLVSVSKKGVGGSLILPSYNFDYDKNNAVANPDFDKDAFDRWGYYKSDVQLTGPAGYQYPVDRETNCSELNAAAWSLRQIELPVGAKIKVDYESDMYYRIGSKDIPFPIPDEYLMFRRSRDYFFSFDFLGPYTINIPTTPEAFYFRQEMVSALANNALVSVIIRNSNTGEEACENLTIESITPIAQFEQVIFNDNNIPALEEEWSVIAVALISNKFPYPVICGTNDDNGERGGGIRVKEIQLLDGNNDIKQKQEYTYHTVLNGSSYSSGVVPYEPSSMNIREGFVMFSDNPNTNTFGAGVAAQVNYSEVNLKTKSGSDDFISHTKYRFETYDQPTHLGITYTQSSEGNYDRIYTTTIDDRTSQVGRPLSIEGYNSLGHRYSKKAFEYYTDPPSSQGVIKENTHSIRARIRSFGRTTCLLDGFSSFTQFSPGIEQEEWKVLLTERNTYPSVLRGVRTIDQGMESSIAYVDFDFFTGKTTATEKTDMDGFKTLSVSTPAYQEYDEMGSKVDDPDNRNMLSQETENFVFRDGIGTQLVTGSGNWSGCGNCFEITFPSTLPVQEIHVGATVSLWNTNNSSSSRIITSHSADRKTFTVEATPAEFPGGIARYPVKAYPTEFYAASVQTWSESDYNYRTRTSSGYTDEMASADENKWRPYQSYIWDVSLRPDGTMAPIIPFDFEGPINSNWLKTTEITRYDRYSNVLEEKNIDDNYNAVKMGYDDTHPIIAAKAAKYVEMAFSSAEDKYPDTDWFGGEVKSPVGMAVVNTKAHTGDYSVRLGGGIRYGFSYKIPCRVYNQSVKPGEIERQKKYEARVWVHESNVAPNFDYLYCSYENNAGDILGWKGVRIDDPTTIKAGEWYQLRLPIEINNTDLLYCTKISVGTWINDANADFVYFDDFRFAPINAGVTSYVYDHVTEKLTHTLDQENFYTQYVYDSAGHLTKVYQETTENPTGKQLVSEHDIHFKRPLN